MKLWPFSKQAENRESGGDFTDAVVRLIEAQAAGQAADAGSTAAVEAASGAIVSRILKRPRGRCRMGAESRHAGCVRSNRA